MRVMRLTRPALLVLAATLCACGGVPDLPVADAQAILAYSPRAASVPMRTGRW